ncbi:unnamed protein product [Arabidopsis thaliana]|uniref:(thale cress) hypothetical protein n=1 Tax=Arabidopsis thaliana TaxID=3702 RepID=A0A7G2ENU6_ARATH|nr:unnamed protein product [Arabidopsis thaliana]
MRSRQLHNVSEDRETLSRRNKRSKTSLNGHIPIDLLIEIFLKLPVKSIATCRSVSKFWTYVLGRQDFTELFLTKSSSRPQLLFACANDNGYFFFSSNQPQNLDENSSPIAAYPLTHVPKSRDLGPPINGLVSLRGERILKGRIRPVDVSIIYNPSTGESLTLPKTNMNRKKIYTVTSFLGYDPIEKQYKVLSMNMSYEKHPKCEGYQVLTLGTGKLSGRMIKCCLNYQHPLKNSEICINGVLYYLAMVNGSSWPTRAVVCFDIRSEMFNFMEVYRELSYTTTLINYNNGKLGMLMGQEAHKTISGICRSFELWVLEDTVKHEWSKHVYLLPPLWKDAVANTRLYFAGMIGTSEIVLFRPDEPLCVFYYNIDRNTIKRVGIRGLEAFKYFRIFLNHVENVKLF